MAGLYMYVVDRDFGFAPNPFHGCCTLATCKPKIRKAASIGDWVVGMGGGRLKATGRCVFGMQVTETISFDGYWHDSAYSDKKPVRNGSRRMLVGDNVYRRGPGGGWLQADSHHSNPDGTVNRSNLESDTAVDRVLVARHFFYFGGTAPVVPPELLEAIGFKNGRGHRSLGDKERSRMVAWLENSFGESANQVLGDPFDFEESAKRYSAAGNKVR